MIDFWSKFLENKFDMSASTGSPWPMRLYSRILTSTSCRRSEGNSFPMVLNMLADWSMPTVVSFWPCKNKILGHKSSRSSESEKRSAWRSMRRMGEFALYPSWLQPMTLAMAESSSTPLDVSCIKWAAISYTPANLDGQTIRHVQQGWNKMLTRAILPQEARSREACCCYCWWS